MDSVLNLAIYPFLFMALFFEVFAILSFFDKNAIMRRGMRQNNSYPTVSIIVPCHNEAATLSGTVDSLLALEYPKDKLSIILVDDGSTDQTFAVMAKYNNNPHVAIIKKENGGKHTALNAGVAAIESEFVGCLDADSFVAKDALKHVMANFDQSDIGAVTSSMSVHAPKNIVERVQEAEYLFGVMLRHSIATVNGLHVTPGPFTIFRKKIFDELGLFKAAHNTEDMEIALRLQKAGWKIQNAPRALVTTTTPQTLRALITQRTRWTTGFLRNSADYRELIGNPKNGILGLLILPLGIISIFSSVVLFFISTINLGQIIWETAVSIIEVPLSFTFSLHWLDWFFVPVNTIAILSLITLVVVFWLIRTGARIAEKKSGFGVMFVWYFLLYSVLSVVWQARAVWDVLFGIRRSWR